MTMQMQILQDKKNAEKRISQLRAEIEYHNKQYYLLDAPDVADSTYDKMMAELMLLEDAFPDINRKNSPTQKVGAKPLNQFRTLTHVSPMLSLANAFSENDIALFAERVGKIVTNMEDLSFVVEPKIDGVAINLTYADGKLISAATRGDGTNGEDVSANIRTIASVPSIITPPLSASPVPSFLEIRGEVYLEKEAFHKLNKTRIENSEPPCANPRTAAAGSLRQLNATATAQRPLKLFVYAIGKTINKITDANFSSHWEALNTLRLWGFPVNNISVRAKSIAECLDQYKHLAQQRDLLPYEIDGMVIKINELSAQEQVGTVSRSPRWAIAYKFAAMQEETLVTDITVQVGRTGVLTPVAILSPVEVGGVVVSRATLHNMDEIGKKDIRIGDTVLLQRAGDVIPKIVEVIATKRNGTETPFVMPALCPVCGSDVVRNKEEAAHRCSNPSCKARMKEQIKHFVSRNGMDIVGFGEELAKQLIEKNIIATVADIYSITLEILLTLDGVAQKSAVNILNAINASKRPPFEKLIFALGIRHVGEYTAELLAKEFANIDALASTDKENILLLRDIGEEVATSIVEFFANDANKTILEKLRISGVTPTYAERIAAKENNRITGKAFVFTGALSRLGRNEVKKSVESLGGKTSESISKNIDFLVMGTKGGSKMDKAKALGIAVLDEDEFLKMLEESRA